MARVGKRTCGALESGWCRQLGVHSRLTGDEMTRRLDNYHCTLLCGILRCSFQETVPRNTAENTVKHRGGGVGLVVANHCGGGETSMVVTTLLNGIISPICPHNMMNFSLLAAEMWQHYCTQSSSGRQPNFAALNTGCYLYSAGRPSRWALAHILADLNLQGARYGLFERSVGGTL